VSRYFTPEEAAALLPRVRELVRDIRDSRVHLAEDQAQLATWHIKLRGNGNARHDEITALQDAITTATEHMSDVLDEIRSLGILLKDPDAGLVDFPALRQDREVYLCWRLGEAQLAWWHEVADGFVGRRPLTDF
jgi:hypothetical protein